MSVNGSWLVNVNLSSNTTVIQAPNFNKIGLLGVFPKAALPSSWGGNLSRTYSSYSEVSTDFLPKITGSTLQDNQYFWLIQDAYTMFLQNPTPSTITLCCLDTTATDKATALRAIIDQDNSVYAYHLSDLITATNVAANITAATGLGSEINNQNSLGNPKFLSINTSDSSVASTIKASSSGNSNHLCVCYHAANYAKKLPTDAMNYNSYGAAGIADYFVDLFTFGVGLKPWAGAQYAGLDGDNSITSSTIGDTSSGLIGNNNNIYPIFNGTAISQYGLVSSSTNSNLQYIDQVVGSDWLKLNLQNAYINLIVDAQKRGGLIYNNIGINSVINVAQGVCSTARDLNIIQDFKNSDFVAVPFENTPLTDITNRIYKGLKINLRYLSRQQRLSINLNLSL